MDATAALVLVGALLTVTTAVGVIWRTRVGRLQRARTADDVHLASLGIERTAPVADIVQFSTEYCARCPGVRRALISLAAADADVAVHEVDLTRRPHLASEFRITQTPTVVVIAPSGGELARFTGGLDIERLRDLIASRKGAIHDVAI